MRKIFLNSGDWKTILLGATGFPQMKVELYSIMKDLASRSDVVIILTEDDKPEMVLKFDEIERNPESLVYNDLKIMYTIYKKELELKLAEQ